MKLLNRLILYHCFVPERSNQTRGGVGGGEMSLLKHLFTFSFKLDLACSVFLQCVGVDIGDTSCFLEHFLTG